MSQGLKVNRSGGGVEVVEEAFTGHTSAVLNSNPVQFPSSLKGKDNVLLYTEHTSSSNAEMYYFIRGRGLVNNGVYHYSSMLVWDHDNATLATTGVSTSFNKDKKTLYLRGW